MWRYMLFINELNEGLTEPSISIGAVLLIVIGIIDGLGLR